MIRIEERITEHGTVTILQRRANGAFVYDQDGSHQSEADADGTSRAAYVHALFDFLSQSRARDVLMIGCGGGTLATMLARTGCRVTLVDTNQIAFEFARRYFKLPAEVVCHIGDGRDYLLQCTNRYDAIVLDAFQGDRIPPHLTTPAVFKLVAARLHKTGLFLANIYIPTEHDDSADCLARAACAAWPTVRLWDTSGSKRNALVVAGNVRQLQLPSLRLRPQGFFGDIEEELHSAKFRNWRPS